MMPASQGKAFSLEHCWKLPKKSEKWKLREHELPPKRGAFTKMEDDDVSFGGKNKDKPDGNKKAKEKLKKQAEASNLREKINHMVQSNKMMVAKTLEAKTLLAE